MATAKIGTSLLTAVAVLLGSIGLSDCHHHQTRTLDFSFNEGCGEFCKNTSIRLGHVKASGPNDTLHYLWDFTENPTIFIAVTSHSAKLQIDWHNYKSRKPNSLNFTEKPIYTFGVVIERLLEFNDISGDAKINEINNSDIKELKLKDFQWNYENLTKRENFVEFFTQAKNYKNPQTNETRSGSVQFLLHGFSTLNHSHITPCMLHSENATQIDMVIDHLQTNTNFSKSRFALELLIVSESVPNTTFAVDTKRKVDDEFTPGVFEITELTTPVVHDKSGYLQWRPVSYVEPSRDISNSIVTIHYPVKSATVDNYFNNNNLLYMYYGENMFNNLVKRMNISLGGTDDDVYTETKYSTWTFIVGYGSPPDERFSRLAIMVICIGIGLPLIILTISGFYVCLRRTSKH